ncbi:MAG: TM2 domain-containing protein [Maritimibacter sp.]|jgi:TM2 domain-containing membrane protein YozV
MQLSTQQQMLVEQRLSNEKKSSSTAYLLWFFLSAFSAHRFYLGTTGAAIGQLILFWGGWVLSVVLVGIPMLIAWGIWWVVDGFRIGKLIEQDAAAKRSTITNEVALTTQAN